MIYGYARVSTDRQSISRQEHNILRYDSTAILYADKYSGTTTDRPQWHKLLNVLQQGDTIIFDSVSRMSRNASEGVQQYFMLYDMGIHLIFLNEMHINTEVYQNALQGGIATVGNTIADMYISTTNEVLKLLAQQQIQIAFHQAEKEVADLKKRVSEGMKIKKAGNKISKARKGKTYETQKAKDIKKIMLNKSKYFGGHLNDRECRAYVCEVVGKCSEPTFYKYKAELLAERGQIMGQLEFKTEEKQ